MGALVVMASTAKFTGPLWGKTGLITVELLPRRT